ncbi:unnamed protein product [Amoebophrya sp. A120]|nr:unnamed protein product [Amoebophrya sp. A120]|eukprot:GSA120T00018083001.1
MTFVAEKWGSEETCGISYLNADKCEAKTSFELVLQCEEEGKEYIVELDYFTLRGGAGWKPGDAWHDIPGQVFNQTLQIWDPALLPGATITAGELHTVSIRLMPDPRQLTALPGHGMPFHDTDRAGLPKILHASHTSSSSTATAEPSASSAGPVEKPLCAGEWVVH